MRLSAFLLLGLLTWSCGDCPCSTTPANVSSTVVFNAVLPPSGSVVVLPQEYPYILPGGIVIPQGSGHISAGLTLTSGHDVPWAQLNVYLLTSEPGLGYCGQNTPDSPTWSFLTPGWRTSYSVTGFRVYRLPCDVTGLRAMLHMRNTGNLTPPIPSETIAEATFPVSFRITR